MCGRFTRTSSRDALATEFGVVQFVNIDFAPRYNIAPSQSVEAIVSDGRELRMGPMRWGFTTASAQEVKPAPINARAETIASTALFREAFRRRRCLVVADGFYEWRADGGRKIPFFVHLRSGRPFAFAAIWSSIRTDADRRVATCAILTCAPNELMTAIHNRMPVILPAGARERWLDPSVDTVALRALLVPLPSAQMEAYPVSTLINSSRNDSPECIMRIQVS